MNIYTHEIRTRGIYILLDIAWFNSLPRLTIENQINPKADINILT